MSIFGSLALMATALFARPRPPDVEITELKAKIDDLTRERDEARVERDRWRSLAFSWERRYELASEYPNLAQRMAQHAQMAQHPQMAQQAQMAMMNAYPQGMLGAQGLQLPADYCNCVPARHDMLIRG